MQTKRYWWRTIASFLFVLFMMPLGHASMIIMEHTMSPSAVHIGGFLIGLLGFILVIWGVFVKGDTKQTLFGLIGALFFWTGWVEFLFQYYAHRHGTQPEIVNGEIVTKPEYLILSATFGLWIMMMLVYMFCTKTGCNFINWLQKKFFRDQKNEIVSYPMVRHTAITTFMEFNMIMWSSYLLLMFCYDPAFIGDHSIITYAVGAGCLIGSLFMFERELRLKAWGANIRMAIATVIIFWVPVEVLGRIDFFNEFWTKPQEYATPILIILAAFLTLGIYLGYKAISQKRK